MQSAATDPSGKRTGGAAPHFTASSRPQRQFSEGNERHLNFLQKLEAIPPALEVILRVLVHVVLFVVAVYASGRFLQYMLDFHQVL